MGRVYAAEHVMMRKKLAVKILHRELTTVPEVVKRFEREAMAAANIEDPNVAAATDFGKLPDGSVFMAMEFVEGQSLRDEIAAGPLRSERALRIGRQIGSALASAHALDIVHRDLKPENVMLVTKGSEPDFVKVLDFGIAKVPIGQVGASGGNPITKVGMVFGTPEYMAPEQALGQPVDARADLYALGVILYEMLAGVRPFSSSSQTGILGQQLSRPAPPFVERAPGAGVPPAVEQVVLKLLQREANDRFQTAVEVVVAIEALMGATPGNGQLFTQLAGSVPQSLSGTGSIPDLEGAASSAHLASTPNGFGLGSAPDVTSPSGSIPDPLDVARVPFPAPPGTVPGTASIESPTAVGGGQLGPTGGTLVVGSVRAAMGSQPRVGAAAAFPTQLPEWVPLPVVDFLSRAERWREGLPVPLDRVPVLGYLAAAFALVFGGFLLVVVLLLVTWPRGKQDLPEPASSGSASLQPDVAPAVAAASSDELKAARRAGGAALRQLAEKYPRDARVLVALARVQRDAQEHAAAVETVKRALKLAPELRQNADVATVLWVTVQDPATRDAAFELLEGPMGSRGAEIAYDLIVTPKIGAAVRQRADEFVRSPRFEKVANPEIRIAVKLRDARQCDEIHALLDEAVRVGDSRSLPYLRRLQNTKTCKVRRRKVDCWPCLRGDGKLVAAIEAAASRPADARPAP
jgi:serine/threonine protein kinase